MKPTLQFRIAQQLTLTPQLQQAIRMLQLSTVELAQEVEQALRDNPLLERIDESIDSLGTGDFQRAGGLPGAYPGSEGEAHIGIDASTAMNGHASASSWDEAATSNGNLYPADGPSTPAPLENLQRSTPGVEEQWEAQSLGAPAQDAQDWDVQAWDAAAWDAAGWDQSTPDPATWDTDRRQDGGEDPASRDWRGAGYRLAQHLEMQLMGCHVSERDKALVEWLINALDEDGLLREPIEALIVGLPAEAEVEIDELLTALKLLQSFDPPGVAARSAQECLSIQLRQRPATDASHLALRIVNQHLSSLAQRDFARLRRQLGCSEAILREAHAMILSLNPRPASGFQGGDPMPYVVPDVVVKLVGRRWQAFALRGGLPDIRLNERYVRLLEISRESRAEGADLSEQIQSARWLVKNLRQRGKTILRVARFIAEHQQRFFSDGAVAMLPLAMRTVAEALELHESTISRVTTQKFMLTPLGTFELKYFFTGHVGGNEPSEGAHSSTAIRARVKQIIASESAERPMSDSHIAKILSAEGTQVARRTVAKYRELLRIPPTSQRRKQRF
jgi:RNA polymerase sigma-54 factor